MMLYKKQLGITGNRIIFVRARPLLDTHVFAAFAQSCASEHRAHDYMDAGRLQGPRYLYALWVPLRGVEEVRLHGCNR